MSTPETLPRPPQVTMLGWMIVIGSVLVVVNVFEMLGGLRSLDTREMVQEYLVDGPGSSLGWSIETGLAALRITAMVAAACAAATAVLGIFALQRNRGARVGLSTLAVPLFVTGAVAGGFMSSLVAAAVALLWMQPSRDWFAGRKPKPATPLGRDDSGARNPFARPESDQDREHGQVDAPEPRVPVGSGGAGEPTAGRPVEGFGDRPTWGAGTPAPGVSEPVAPPQDQERPGRQSPYGHAPGTSYGEQAPHQAPHQAQHPGQHQSQHQSQHWAQQPAPVSQRRPAAVIWAAVLTWLFAGLTFAASALAVLVLAGAPDQVRGEIDRVVADLEAQGGTGGQEITADMLITTTAVVGVVVAAFSLVACLAAVLLVVRRTQGSVLLMITSAFSAGFCLLAGVASLTPALLLPAVASGVVIALLLRKDVRGWLRSR